MSNKCSQNTKTLCIASAESVNIIQILKERKLMRLETKTE